MQASRGRPSHAAAALLALCLAAAPVAAHAQAGGRYQVTTAPGTFVPLSGAAPVGAVTSAQGVASGATIALGFPMPLFGVEHAEVYVNTNGQVVFGGTSDAPKPYAAGLGDPAPPNGWLSPWWSSGSLAIESAADLTWQVTGQPRDHVAVVQWARWGFNKGKRRSMQVALFEATKSVELRYGPIEAKGVSAESALAGGEGPGGEPVEGLACDRDQGYLRQGCISSQWPAEGTVVTLTWTPEGADLVGEPSIVRVTDAGGALLAVTVHARVRNLGASPAPSFGLQFWAGTDLPFDRTRWTQVGTSAQPLSVGPLSEAGVEQVVLVTRPSGPQLRVGLVVDPGYAVAEADEANNTAASPPVAVGVDLAATAVAGPASAALGDAIRAAVSVRNRGTDRADATVALYLVSSGASPDPARDREVARTLVSLDGAAAATVEIDGVVPVNLFTATEQRWAALIDPEWSLPDVDRTNDAVVAGQACTLRAPDLKVERVTAGAGPHFFGEPVQLGFELANLGEADAREATVGLYLSDNPVISLADRFLGKVEGLAVAAGGRTSASLEVVLPATVDGTRPYAAGTWYLGAVADPMLALGEANEGNNAQPGAPLLIRPAAPDLAAISLVAPLQVSPAEPFAVALEVANHGVRPSAPFGLALGWSANAIPSPLDAPLPLWGPDEEPLASSPPLEPGERRRTVVWTRLPADVPSGELWLSLRVDPQGLVGELSEQDNAAVSAVVEVVPSRVRIVDRALPDLIVGAEFGWDLSATGCAEGCAWRLLGGAGALPDGISLSAEGRLEGRPARAGQWTFAVEASQGGAVDVAAFAVRVFSPSSNLAVVTASLPDAVEGVAYGAAEGGATGVALVATGGVPPFAWRLAPGSGLPDGMDLRDGRVVGTPATGAAGESSVKVELRDGQGSKAERVLPLRVRAQGGLSFSLATLPAAEQGRGYAQPLGLSGAVPPVSAELVEGSALPDGLRLSASAQLPLLFGTPTVAGAFPVVVRARDGSSASATRAFVLLVSAQRLELVPRKLADARQGEAYSAALAPDLAGARASLCGGALPPGLSLTADGVVEGVVEAGARPASYDFQVVLSTPTGDAEAAYTVAVRAEPRPYPAPAATAGCGCAASPGNAGQGVVLALVLGMVLGRSKRRQCV